MDGQGERAGASGCKIVAIGPTASGDEMPDHVAFKAMQRVAPAEAAAPKQAAAPAPEPAPAARKTGPVVLSAAGQEAAARAKARAAERAAGNVPADLAAYDAKIASMTPEQRDAISRAALGSLHPSRATEDGAARQATAQARAKAMWGSVEEAGRLSREKIAASQPAEQSTQKAGKRAAATQRAS